MQNSLVLLAKLISIIDFAIFKKEITKYIRDSLTIKRNNKMYFREKK